MVNLFRMSALILIPSIGLGQALTDDGINVGIGNASPMHRLDVGGDVNIATGNALLIGGNQVVSARGARNVFLGDGTGTIISTGGDNAVIGFKAAEQLSTGRYNTVIGFKAAQTMSTALSNTIIGREAGKFNRGNQNVLIGRESGKANEGGQNTFIGNRVGLANMTGSMNTLIGSNSNVGAGGLTNATAIGAGAVVSTSNSVVLGNGANVGIGNAAPSYDLDVTGNINFTGNLYHNGVLYSVPPGAIGQTIYHNGTNWVNTSNLSNDGTTVTMTRDALINGVSVGLGGGNVSTNTANGARALYSNTTGFANTAIGDSSLYSNIAGSFNTATGYQALYSNTEGNNNTANGMWALYNNTEGFANIAMGNFALLSNTTGDMNTANGNAALLFNITGSNNTAIGSSALYMNTGGDNNAAFGNEALYSNSTGSDNTANGYQALYSNTAGNNNTAIGKWSLFNNTEGFANTAIGNFTLLSNTNGDRNTANGYSALHSNTTGSENTANGSAALFSNTTGVRNTASGVSVLYANTTGNYNTASGYGALSQNISGSSNTANGHLSLLENTTGFNNTGIGKSGLRHNTTGYYNSGIGFQVLYSNTTGYRNTANGYFALAGNTTGSYGTALGHHTNSVGNDYDNTTGMGYNSDPTASNTVRIGNSSVTSIGGEVGWTTLSDKRFKTDIRKDEVKGLEFIAALEPVTYNYDLTAQAKWKEVNYGEPDTALWSGKFDIEEIRFSGFIAQDVEILAKDIGYNFSGVDAPKNDKDVYGIRYAEFVVPLVKAVQELNAERELQEKRLDAQLAENKELRSMLLQVLENQQRFESNLEQCCLNHQSEDAANANSEASELNNDPAVLEQNQPNPFRENTAIKYYLPEGTSSAQIQISDLSGTVLKSFNLQGKGFGQVMVSGGSFEAGTYLYSLIINGERIDSKRMMLL